MPWRRAFDWFACTVLCVQTAHAQMINEILFDPHPEVSRGDANGDGRVGNRDDEFVEIVNERHAAVDLSGWTLSDETTVRHVFPDGSMLSPGCAVVVFGGGNPQGTFGGALVQTASTGTLMLNNWGDTIRLKHGVQLVAEYTYGAGVAEESVTRNPDFGPEPLMAHSQVPGATRLQSPGTASNGEPFRGCSAVPVDEKTWSVMKQLYRRRQP